MRRLVPLALLMAVSACGSSGGSDDGSNASALVERTCEIVADIVNDAADQVDSIPETRDRFKDLLDGYGESAPADIANPLRDVVSALTSMDNSLLESSLNDLTSACNRHLSR